MDVRPPAGTRAWVQFPVIVREDNWQEHVDVNNVVVQMEAGWNFELAIADLMPDELGKPLGYMVVGDARKPLQYVADWDGEIHPSREEAEAECHNANTAGNEPGDRVDDAWFVAVLHRVTRP